MKKDLASLCYLSSDQLYELKKTMFRPIEINEIVNAQTAIEIFSGSLLCCKHHNAAAYIPEELLTVTTIPDNNGCAVEYLSPSKSSQQIMICYVSRGISEVILQEFIIRWPAIDWQKELKLFGLYVTSC